MNTPLAKPLPPSCHLSGVITQVITISSENTSSLTFPGATLSLPRHPLMPVPLQLQGPRGSVLASFPYTHPLVNSASLMA